MLRYLAPDQFDFSKAASWPDRKSRFLRYHTLEKLGEERGNVQVSALVCTMGRQAESICSSFVFDSRPAQTEAVPDPPQPREVFSNVLAKFDAYFVPKKNITHKGTKLYQRSQRTGESVERFIMI